MGNAQTGLEAAAGAETGGHENERGRTTEKDWKKFSEQLRAAAEAWVAEQEGRQQQPSFSPSAEEKASTLLSFRFISSTLDRVPLSLFDSLTHLTDLDLSHNRLTSLPAQVARLQHSLTRLNLSGNRLTTLSEEGLNSLDRLQSLTLSYNALTELPEMDRLTALTNLNVGFNALQRLPERCWLHMKQLRELELSGNRLRRLPATMMAGLKDGLQVLGLYDNKLCLLSCTASSWASLRQEKEDEKDGANEGALAAEEEGFTFHGFRSLKRLMLAKNALQLFPSTTTPSHSTMHNGDGDDKIESYREGEEKTNGKTKQRNGLLSSYQKNFFRNVTNLESLDLSLNRIEALPGTFCFCLRSCLVSLNLSDNRLTALPPSLDLLSSLSVLYAQNNALSFIPEELCQVTTLQKLHLSGNKIQQVPRHLTQLQNLKILDLRNNLIVDIDDELMEMGRSGHYNAFYWDIPDEILPNLFLGSSGAASNWSALRKRGITHVLSVASQCSQPPFPKKLKYKVVPAEDTDGYNISQHFDECKQFIDSALDASQRVLVHCVQGRSRSGSIVLAYLMASRGMTYDDALRFAQEKRPTIKPNPHFEQQLREYERHCVHLESSSSNSHPCNNGTDD
ncbi:non-specific serine/threonine protein kinase [Balamuthia mandrillaris]